MSLMPSPVVFPDCSYDGASPFFQKKEKKHHHSTRFSSLITNSPSIFPNSFFNYWNQNYFKTLTYKIYATKWQQTLTSSEFGLLIPNASFTSSNTHSNIQTESKCKTLTLLRLTNMNNKQAKPILCACKNQIHKANKYFIHILKNLIQIQTCEHIIGDPLHMIQGIEEFSEMYLMRSWVDSQRRSCVLQASCWR